MVRVSSRRIPGWRWATLLFLVCVVALGSLMMAGWVLFGCFGETSNDKKSNFAAPVPVAKSGLGFTIPAASEDFSLLILILSARKNQAHRQVIRDTWLQDLTEDIFYKFVLGSGPESVETHPDIVIMEKVPDSYHRLTDKLISGFTWFRENVRGKFLLKVDDDSFVTLPALTALLKQHTSDRSLYMGFMDGRAQVKRKGKWAEPKWTLCDRYLPYAKGGGYILSFDLVEYLATNNRLLRHYVSEDVSVGAWMAGLDVDYVHSEAFDTEYVSRGCQNHFVVTHKKDPSQMHQLYASLKSTGKLCGRETVLRPSYIYNWEVPPSQCCERKPLAP